ncbi:hypothetical protein TRVA0_080S00320 [Trichomonascus vanleenenianus]|uniref:SUMO protease ULP1 n=1 Tax=Trichomonascus vanleenenianus TaxID=2268995 RepID=UPI003EC9F9BB
MGTKRSSSESPYTVARSSESHQPAAPIDHIPDRYKRYTEQEDPDYYDEGWKLDWITEVSGKIVAGATDRIFTLARGIAHLCQNWAQGTRDEAEQRDPDAPFQRKRRKIDTGVEEFKPVYIKPQQNIVGSPMGLTPSKPRDTRPLSQLLEDQKKEQAAAQNGLESTPKQKKKEKPSGGLFTPLAETSKSSNISSGPLFQALDGPLHKPENRIVPSVTYGTSFFFQNKPTGQQPNGRRDMRLDSYRNSFEKQSSPSDSSVIMYDIREKPRQFSSFGATPLRNYSGGLFEYSRGLQHVRRALERQREEEARIKAIKWDEETKLPSRDLELQERRSKYAEIIARHKLVKEGVEELKRLKTAKPKDKPVLPLSGDKIKEVNRVWSMSYSTEAAVTAYRISVTFSDLSTLKPGQWLNDNIIDYYLAMVTERSQGKSFAFSTHFYTTLQTRGYDAVAKWAKRKKIDVTQLDYLFVPINRNNTHWCLAVVNNVEKKIQFFDSMGGYGMPALELLREYMIAEASRLHADRHGEFEQLYTTQYQLCDKLACPQQHNGSDCGVFTTKMVEVMSRNVDFAFSQKDMPTLRQRMVYEIVQKEFVP